MSPWHTRSFYSKNMDNKHQTPQWFQDKNIDFYKLQLLFKQTNDVSKNESIVKYYYY